jgi:hypothetical protein
MIELTDEQRRQLESGRAVEVTDSGSDRPYVVLSKDFYDRLRQFVYDASEWTDDDLRRMLANSSGANGWDEPGMVAYDRYDLNGHQCLRVHLSANG